MLALFYFSFTWLTCCQLAFTVQIHVNQQSVTADVQEGTSEPVQVNPMRFRPNLLISGGEPYSEDGWTNLKIGNNYFTVCSGNPSFTTTESYMWSFCW